MFLKHTVTKSTVKRKFAKLHVHRFNAQPALERCLESEMQLQKDSSNSHFRYRLEIWHGYTMESELRNMCFTRNVTAV